jgi:hypothetical protein
MTQRIDERCAVENPELKNSVVVAALVTFALAPLAAQDAAVRDNVPLRVQVVLSRFDGEKKLSSLPYTIIVNAQRDPRAVGVSMRMGVEVPVVSSVMVPKEGAAPSYTYRGVGTNIDCSAVPLDDGRYRLTFAIEQSSVLPGDTLKAEGPPPVPTFKGASAPVFRSFKTTFAMALREGQSAQHTSATDPVSGETLKVDITVNSVK